jgi:hypothetical protein
VNATVGTVNVHAQPIGYHIVCLAELPCVCEDHKRHSSECKHIQVVQLYPDCPTYTHSLRVAGAKALVEMKALQPVNGTDGDTSTKLHRCDNIYGSGNTWYTVSPHNPNCLCVGFRLHGTCIHLMAAAQLLELEDVVSAANWQGMDAATELPIVPTSATTPPGARSACRPSHVLWLSWVGWVH